MQIFNRFFSIIFMGIRERLIKYLIYKNISKYKFYQKTGFSNGFLDKSGAIGSDKCEKICYEFPDINLEWLITGKEPMLKGQAEVTLQPATIGVPLYDVSAAAGFSSFEEMINNEKLLGNFTIPGFKNIDWMIYVAGSSMYPKYSSGDIIGCRVLRESRFIQWGKVYVIATREQGILVKRLKKSQKKDCIKAVPDNPNYDSFDIPNDEILGIALVVGVIRLE
jgi:phage repressor protein C with HTH and peptisase S24 domain